jgi:transaldolase
MPEFKYDKSNPGPCCQKIDDMIQYARPIVERWPADRRPVQGACGADGRMSLTAWIAGKIIDRQYNKILKGMEVNTMTYKLMKRIIENGIKKGNLDRESTMQKLDVFLMADRITVEEYQELVEMMEEGGTDE